MNSSLLYNGCHLTEKKVNVTWRSASCSSSIHSRAPLPPNPPPPSKHQTGAQRAPYKPIDRTTPRLKKCQDQLEWRSGMIPPYVRRGRRRFESRTERCFFPTAFWRRRSYRPGATHAGHRCE